MWFQSYVVLITQFTQVCDSTYGRKMAAQNESDHTPRPTVTV